jgi:phosphomannomutase
VVGIGLDEDGDRMILVRSDGRAVEGDRALCIQAKQLLEEHRSKGKPGRPRFIGEVKFSRVVEDFIVKMGGEYIMTPTGFAFIKSAVKKIYSAIKNEQPAVKMFGKMIDLSENRETVALAAELSGHQMAGHEENWIFDDGTLAAARMLAVIAVNAKKGKTFIDLDEEIPRYPISPEINIRLPINKLEEKAELVNIILGIFYENGFPMDVTDGGIIKWLSPEMVWLGQVLVRKSNTQPMLICRVEAKDQCTLEAIENEFFTELAMISTDTVPKIDLASDDYVRNIMARIPPEALS